MESTTINIFLRTSYCTFSKYSPVFKRQTTILELRVEFTMNEYMNYLNMKMFHILILPNGKRISEDALQLVVHIIPRE